MIQRPLGRTVVRTVLTSGLLVLGLAAPRLVHADLDHFKCYQTKPTPGAARFTRHNVTLTDAFESVNSVATKSRAICNPVDKNGEGIDDPTAHLACFSTRDDRQTKFVQRDVQVTNQFGVQALRVIKPYQVCVAAEKGIVPDEPTPSELNLDDFRCYKAKTKSGSAPVSGVVVELADQFETRMAVVGPAIRFCNPVDTGSGIVDPDAHLTCYKLTRVPTDLEPAFVPKPITIVSDLLGELAVTARPLPHLCVPSLAEPIVTTTTITSTTTTTTAPPM